MTWWITILRCCFERQTWWVVGLKRWIFIHTNDLRMNHSVGRGEIRFRACLTTCLMSESDLIFHSGAIDRDALNHMVFCATWWRALNVEYTTRSIASWEVDNQVSRASFDAWLSIFRTFSMETFLFLNVSETFCKSKDLEDNAEKTSISMNHMSSCFQYRMHHVRVWGVN